MLVTNLTNITCYKNPQNVSIHLRFVWQAWHLVTSTFVLRGRSGAYLGMALDWLWRRAWAGFSRRDAAALCVAGVALGDIHLRFAWQAWHLWHLWHLWHWTGSGGALGPVLDTVTPRHFAWQAWRLVTSTFVSRGRRGTWWPTVVSRGRGGTYGTGLAPVGRLGRF